VRGISASPNRVVAFVLGFGFGVDATVCLVGGRVVLGILFGIAAAVLVLAAIVGISPARVANLVAGTVWLALGYAGLFLVGSEFNVLALTAIDEVVLFAAAVVHLAVALGARRDRASDDALSSEP
jgi:hypothetical protein